MPLEESPTAIKSAIGSLISFPLGHYLLASATRVAVDEAETLVRNRKVRKRVPLTSIALQIIKQFAERESIKQCDKVASRLARLQSNEGDRLRTQRVVSTEARGREREHRGSWILERSARERANFAHVSALFPIEALFYATRPFDRFDRKQVGWPLDSATCSSTARPLEPPCHGHVPLRWKSLTHLVPRLKCPLPICLQVILSGKRISTNQRCHKVLGKGKEDNLGLRSQLTLEFSRAVQLLPTKAC